MRDEQVDQIIKELEMRRLFHQLGEKKTAPVSFVQNIDDYVESFHSMSSWRFSASVSIGSSEMRWSGSVTIPSTNF